MDNSGACGSAAVGGAHLRVRARCFLFCQPLEHQDGRDNDHNRKPNPANPYHSSAEWYINVHELMCLLRAVLWCASKGSHCNNTGLNKF